MKAAIVIVWFGAFPSWVSAFLASCRKVECVDWHIFHDHRFPFLVPENVILHLYSLGAFQSTVRERLGLKIEDIEPYKVCDFRPAFGLGGETWMSSSGEWINSFAN